MHDDDAPANDIAARGRAIEVGAGGDPHAVRVRAVTRLAVVVIASSQWKDGPRPGYSYVDREPSYDQALWVSSGVRIAAKADPTSVLFREVGSEVVITGVEGLTLRVRPAKEA